MVGWLDGLVGFERGIIDVDAVSDYFVGQFNYWSLERFLMCIVCGNLVGGVLAALNGFVEIPISVCDWF